MLSMLQGGMNWLKWLARIGVGGVLLGGVALAGLFFGMRRNSHEVDACIAGVAEGASVSEVLARPCVRRCDGVQLMVGENTVLQAGTMTPRDALEGIHRSLEEKVKTIEKGSVVLTWTVMPPFGRRWVAFDFAGGYVAGKPTSGGLD